MLSIPVKLDVSAERAQKALLDFFNGVEGALEGIVDHNGTVLNFDVNMRLRGKDVVKYLEETDAATEKVIKSAKKHDEGVENSIQRAKYRVKEAKREREALDALGKEYKEAGREIKALENELRSLQGVQDGSIADIKSQRAELVALRDATKINTPEFKKLTLELKKFDKQLTKAKPGANSFVRAFGQIAIVSAGIQAVGSALRSVTNSIDVFVRRTKDVEGFSLALLNVGLQQSEVNRIFKQAETTANDLGAPLAQVEKTYKRMIPALQAVGTSAEDSDKFIEQVSARSQTLGLNTEQSGRLLEAFAQVLSKGKLQAEELNQQISELDGAFRVQFAEALGVTTEALNELISDSKITADVFVDTVNKMSNGAEQLKKRIKDGTATIQQFQNEIGNIDTKNIEKVGAAIEPAIKSFLQIRLAVAEFIQEFSKSKQFELLVDIFNSIAKGVEEFAAGLIKVIGAIGEFLSPLTSVVNFILTLDAGIGNLVTLLVKMAGTITAVALATKGIIALKAGIAFIQQQITNLSAAIKGNGVAAKAATPSMVTYESAVKATGTAATGTTAKLGKLAAAGLKLAALFAVTAIIDKMISSFKAAGEGAEEMNRKFAGIELDLLDKIEEFNNKIEETPESLEDFGESLETVAAKSESAGKANHLAAAAFGVLGVAAIAGAFALGGPFGGALAATTVKGGLAALSVGKVAGAITLTSAAAVSGKAAFDKFAKAEEQLKKSGGGKAFLERQEEIGNAIQRSDDLINSLGVTVDQVDFSNFKGAGADIVEVSRQAKAQVSTLKGNIAANQSLIRELKEKEQVEGTLSDIDKAKIIAAKGAIKSDQQKLAVKERLANASSHFVTQQLKESDASVEAAVNTDDLAKATALFIKEIDVKAVEAQTEAIREYGREANSAELLAAANIGIAAAAAEEKIEQYDREIDKLHEVERTQGFLNPKQRARVTELTNLIAQETNKQAQLSLDAQAAVIAGFEQGVNRVNEKVSVLGETASALKGSFDSTTSTFVSGLQAATGLIDQVVSREIEGLEVGSAKRKAIITEQLRAQAQAIETENSLAKLKLSVQSQVAQSEARIQQGQLQVMAAQARMSGNEGLAKTLDAAALAQNDIIDALQVQERVEKRILDINKQTQQQALIDKGLKEQVGRSAEDVANKIGVQAVNLKEAKAEQQAIQRLVEQYSEKMATAATNAQDLKEETQKTAMKEGKDNAGRIADALGEADGAAEGLNAVMKAVNGTFDAVATSGDRIKTTLKDAITEANTLIRLTGSNARAMGGPVTGGQQYTVNDGGGREAFLSNTGKFSMLPAARNIQWTAPSSGTIISAQVLKAMQRNQRHNGVISNARVDQGPVPKLMAATAMTSDSGSLAKQITTAMSGSTANRITNNVTIQSQSPVNDASNLMTNVARMRLRNSRRF